MGAEATDLLRRFSGKGGVEEAMEEVVGGVEINLGLSLGGFFCEEPRETEEKLLRSASVAVQPDASMAWGPTIGRACSLPVEAEEGRRKRKEMQGLKRMEAKRRRSEKKDFGFAGNDKAGARKAVPVELQPSAMLQGLSRSLGAVSQGSIRSQGSSSSSLSDLESRPAQGFENPGLGSCAEVKSAFSRPSLLNPTNCKATNSPTSAVGKPTKASNEGNNLPKKSARANEMKDAEKIMLEDMPQVHVQGDGPNGKRIEGFLYNYMKGEVRIVCVCHGNFLTPGEFVKHAGGKDVTNPLRHIVVNTSQVAM